MLQNLAREFFLVSGTTSLLILILCWVAPFCRKKCHGRWLYAAWLLLACRLLLPIHLEFALPQAPLLQQSVQYADAWLAQPLTQTLPYPQNIQTVSDTVLTETAPQLLQAIPHGLASLSWQQFITGLWLSGVVIFLLWQGITYWHLRRQIAAAPMAPAAIQQMSQQIQKALNGRCHVVVKWAPAHLPPMLCGLFHPVILLPRCDLTPKQLQLVLQHELLHHCRHDLWWRVPLLLARALHWYNPLVHFAAHQTSQACELACDEQVVAGKDRQERRFYGETILALARQSCRRQTTLATSFYDSKSCLKERLQRMMDMKKKKNGAFLLILLLGASLLLSACVGSQKHPSLLHEETSEHVIAENLPAWCKNMKDFTALADLATPYVGNASAVGQVLGVSPLASYNYSGMSLQTTSEPYGIRLNYIIPEPDLYTRTELKQMADLTALNCFVLIDNLGEVSLKIDFYYTEDGSIEPFHDAMAIVYQRDDVAASFGQDVRKFAKEPTQWRDAVIAYFAADKAVDWYEIEQDETALQEQQAQADEGHLPGQLDPAQVGREFLEALDMLKSSLVSPIVDGACMQEAADHVIYRYRRADGSADEVWLYQPVRQDETGIWAVLRYRNIPVE